MSGSPKFKVYRDKEYVASCKYAEDAAALAAVSGGVVKWDHGVVLWTEGAEAFSAGESYDRAAWVMEDRYSAHLALERERCAMWHDARFQERMSEKEASEMARDTDTAEMCEFLANEHRASAAAIRSMKP